MLYEMKYFLKLKKILNLTTSAARGKIKNTVLCFGDKLHEAKRFHFACALGFSAKMTKKKRLQIAPN